MFFLDQMWLIPALPLVGAALCAVFGKPHPTRLVNLIGVGSTGLAFLAALALSREFFMLSPEHVPWVRSYFTWIAAGNFRADFALEVDQLTVVMLLVVTGVGWLIHIYSTGYMVREGGYSRFFAYLNLFMFFMLLLVMAANYIVLFVGWEGVGLSSYLLIGFYFLKQSASDAGKKAFIVNRIGDFGFLLALILIFRTFGSVDYATVFARAGEMPVESWGQAGVLTLICLLLMAGAAGKSAQLPLYVWLPDAMEGPTPVSALIHAATMVAAGVYMVARSNALFSHAPIALSVVASVGCLTAFYAATIGLVQTDIKRVLAYSTISQLGYMFLGCGVGAFSAAIFHLTTHAFFKALLFLAAGSVIHALGGEQDLRRMGGVRKKIPWTYATMLAGTLAIAGVPGFSGFFSKDAILWRTFASPYGNPLFNKLLWLLGLGSALLTAFYMFRLVFLAFHGTPRFDEHAVHVHESPKSMLIPLLVLALFSISGGWMGIPAALGGADRFEHFLAPVFEKSASLGELRAAAPPAAQNHELELALMGATTFVALAGILLAWLFYVQRPARADRLAVTFHAPYRLLLNKYYVDELYDWLIVAPIQRLSTEVLWRRVDAAGIDGAVNGLGYGAAGFGRRLRQMQSGNTRSYATWVLLGAVVFVTLLIWLQAGSP